jgi:DNA-directed RNA polymerase sigma subunit (sigma70/sigma32)
MSSGNDSENRAKLREEAKKVIESLSDREKEIMRERLGVNVDALSLEQITEKFDSVRERIEEVERKALEKLRNRKGPGEPA